MLTIPDWSQRMESAESRKLKSLNWYPQPFELNSPPYLALQRANKGSPVDYYGIWCRIRQIASQCTPRGTLVWDGKALDVSTIADMARVDTTQVQRAVDVLLSIGLLQVVSSNASPDAPAESPDTPAESPDTPLMPRENPPIDEMRGDERDERDERDEKEPPPPPRGGPADAGLSLHLEEAHPKSRKKEEGPESVKARWLALCSQFPGLPPLRKAPNEVSLRGLRARLKENPDFWQEVASALSRFNPERFVGKWPTFAQVVQAKTFENLISGVYSGPSFKSPAAEAAEKAKREADAREAHRKREIAKARKQEEPAGMPAEELSSKAREWIATRFAPPAAAPVPLEEAREKARAALLNGTQR